MADCWICRQVADKWTNPEARLCANCWSRGAQGLRALDFGVVVNDSKRTIEVEAPPHHAPRITLAFRAESYGSIVKKLIKRELQVGNQAVDDQVYFEVADEVDLPALRGYEASNLMATLTQVASVEVQDSRAMVHLHDSSADVDRVACLAASLLHFLASRQP